MREPVVIIDKALGGLERGRVQLHVGGMEIIFGRRMNSKFLGIPSIKRGALDMNWP